jgi:NADH dehydrogenase/NADH:ubiquinone oxidoreductase subunit G
MVKLTIDDTTVEVSENTTILEAAKEAGIKIPTLCYNKYLKPYGGCRMCLVEVTNPAMGSRSMLVSSCTHPVSEGIVVTTDSDSVIEARKFIIELMLARCPDSSDIQDLAKQYEIPVADEASLDEVGKYLLYGAPKPEHTKCILCAQCVRVCAEVVQRNALSLTYRGTLKKVRTPFDRISGTCIGCGSCAYLCPTNTITVEEAE